MSPRPGRRLPGVSILTPPHVEERPAVPAVGVARRLAMTEIGSLGQQIPVLESWLSERGLAPAGPPFFRYRVIDMAARSLVEAGFPVAGADALRADGEVAVGEIPGGRYAVVVHRCHPDELLSATADLLAWARDEGLRWDTHDTPEGQAWGGRFEHYHTDLAQEPDMASWVTELAFRLAD